MTTCWAATALAAAGKAGAHNEFQRQHPTGPVARAHVGGQAGGGGQARSLPFIFCREGSGGARGGEVVFFPVERGLLVGEAAAQLFALLLVGSHAVFGLLQRAAGAFGGLFGGGDGALLGGFFGVGVALAEDGAAGGEGLCVGLL